MAISFEYIVIDGNQNATNVPQKEAIPADQSQNAEADSNNIAPQSAQSESPVNMHNTNQVEGNNNITIQGAINSAITIEGGISFEGENYNKLKTALGNLGLVNPNSGILNIVIFATNKDEIQQSQKITQELKDSILPYYGDSAKDWRPFREEKSIFELLVEYQEKTGLVIHLAVIDELDFQDEESKREFISEFKSNVRGSAIFIIDLFSLSKAEKEWFIDKFSLDDNEIGGMLIPSCEGFDRATKDKIQEIYKKDFYLLYKYFYVNHHKEFHKLEPNVSNKKELYRRLTNITCRELKTAIPKANSATVLANLKSAYDGKLDSQKPGFK